MTRLRGRAALIAFYHRLHSQRVGNVALQTLFCLPLFPLFFSSGSPLRSFLDFVGEIRPAAMMVSLSLLLLVLLFAWLSVLAWQERCWAAAYYAAARKMLLENSLLLFILEPDYVDTLAPLSRLHSQAAGEQRNVSDVVSRVRHFLRHYGRYQRALLIWRERYAPSPGWRESVWLFLKLTGLAIGLLWLSAVLLGAGAVLVPFLAVFPLLGLMLLKRQARSIGLTLAVFEELTGGTGSAQGRSQL